jgi:Glycosyltransferase family 87
LVSEIRQWAGARVARWIPEAGDTVLYGVSGAFALLVAGFSGIALYRQWAELALGPYLAAAVLSLVCAIYQARWRRSQAPSRGRRAARISVFLVVLIGATVVPLALEVDWRSEGNPSAHVQPEVVVVEHAAHRAVHGKDPYQQVVRDGHEVVSTPGEPEYENFFPYGPLMSVFGLPSSTRGTIKLTDARIFFSLFTLAVTVAALALCRAPREPRIRALQLLTVLPTAALPLATGGDDMPVVAVLLLAMVLAQRRKPLASGVALGIVAAMKFTAWPLAALALFAARDRQDRRRPGLMAAGMALVVVPAMLPFLVNNATAFVQNVILYPLGLSGVPSPAASPMPGHLLVNDFPQLHKVLPLLLVVVGGAVLVPYLIRRPPTSAAAVCSLAGWVMTIAILLAPATRVGYLLYPINFFVWASVFRGADAMALREHPDAVVTGAATATDAIGSTDHARSARRTPGEGSADGLVLGMVSTA